jgi:Predicted transcriptional regulators
MQYIVDAMQYLYYIKIAGGNSMKNKRMKVARIECDMKQDDLAKAVGVTRQTIGLIEAGDYNPSLNLCISICKVLGKTLNDLFWEE